MKKLTKKKAAYTPLQQSLIFYHDEFAAGRMDREELLEVVKGMYQENHAHRVRVNGTMTYTDALSFLADLHHEGRVTEAFIDVFSSPMIADFAERKSSSKVKILVRSPRPEDNLFSFEHQWYKALYGRVMDPSSDESVPNLEALLLIAQKERPDQTAREEVRAAIWYAIEPTTNIPGEYQECIYLDKLLVLPQYRQKKQYGSRLINEMTSRSLKECPKLHSVIVYASESSIPFYTKNGFVRSMQEDWSEREGVHFRRMILPLSREGIEHHDLQASLEAHDDGVFAEVAASNDPAIGNAYLKGVRTLIQQGRASRSMSKIKNNPLLLPLRARAVPKK